VLEEKEASSWAEDPAHLAERPLLVGAAEHERRNDGVEARILEGQILGGSLHDLGPRRLLAHLVLEPAEHRGFGLGDDERVALAVVTQVRAGAAADL
jgi:hypothetical protein